MTPRRLVMCLDGTWNNAYDEQERDDGSKVRKPSNVLKTARAVKTHDDATGRDQLVYYDSGLGSLARYPGIANRLLQQADKTLGGAWGAGFEGNVEEALHFLIHNFRAGDEVFVFGFSRGAATARALTRFLGWSGGLPSKNDAYYLPEIFREYVASRGQTSCSEVVGEIDARHQERAGETGREFHPLDPFQKVEVLFLGVWDTVSALGSRLRSGGDKNATENKSFHVGDEPARSVLHARHALALDERRYDFRPDVWKRTLPGQTLEQRWFAGVHSNVGGGYVRDGMANVALHWILQEAKKQGLVLDDAFLAHYRPYVQHRLYESFSTKYKLFETARLRRNKGVREPWRYPATAHVTLDPSVMIRLRADPAKHEWLKEPYRPDNVLEWLGRQEDLDGFLKANGVNDPRNRELPKDAEKRMEKLVKG